MAAADRPEHHDHAADTDRQRGAKVGLLARGEAGLDAAAEEVRQAGGTALALPTDMADADAVQSAADRVGRELGHIDCWVNNAFSSVFARFQRKAIVIHHQQQSVAFHHGLRGPRPRRGHPPHAGRSISKECWHWGQDTAIWPLPRWLTSLYRSCK